MSTLYNLKYSEFSPDLTDWLVEAGGEVTDLTLRLYNRAQDWLWMKRDWEDLIARHSVTLVGSYAVLPAEFVGRIMRVWHDSNGDGKPDFFYFAKRNVENGYYISNESDFDISTGHGAKKINFYRTPTHTPVVEYVKPLEHFAGSGDEYSYFPPDLLTRTAQKIHIEEADIGTNEVQIINGSWFEMMADYERSHQYRNREWQTVLNDMNGDEIQNSEYNLEGDLDTFSDIYPNDYDRGLG